MIRVVSHTCSNTEIVCALGCSDMLVGVDQDSDFPIDVVSALPQLGRDLSLDIEKVQALKPDLVLSSRTLPGHDSIVEQLESRGLPTLVCEPNSLSEVYDDIRRIAAALNVSARGEALIDQMQTQMPPQAKAPNSPKILIEWWPKPVIAPTQDSWASDLIELAGGCNPWRDRPGKSTPLKDDEIFQAAPDIVVMAWCGVPLEKYRSDVVMRRPGWENVPAVRQQQVHAITEAFLGRPGPRLVDGYNALRTLVSNYHGAAIGG